MNDNFGDSLKGIQIRESFDEEVDGKTTVENGSATITRKVEEKKAKTVSESINNNSSTIKEAVRQSFPHVELEPEQKRNVEIMGTDIEDARTWVRTIFDKIPIRMGAAQMLKDASLRDGKWISYENVENIDDVEYLNSIAANLEDALKLAVGAKA